MTTGHYSYRKGRRY